MTTVDFTKDEMIAELRGVFATKDDIAGFATKDDLSGFATKDDMERFATKDDLKPFATKVDIRDLRRLIEASEDKIVLTVQQTFNEYDKKLSSVRRVVRKHSADIADLQTR